MGTVLYLLLLGTAGNSAALRQVLPCAWPFGSPHPPVAYSYVLAFTKSGQFVFFCIDLQNSLYSLETFFFVGCLCCRHAPLACLWLAFSLCESLVAQVPGGNSGLRKARFWPWLVKMHIKGIHSVSPDSCIFPYREKHSNY